MNYIKITPVDTANGPGCRVVLWLAGCDHHCEGCHNPETWDPDAGHPFTDAARDMVLALLKPNYIRGITITGGDPMHPLNEGTVG